MGYPLYALHAVAKRVLTQQRKYHTITHERTANQLVMNMNMKEYEMPN